MPTFLRRVIGGVLGVIVSIGVWEVRARCSGEASTAHEGFPTTLWEGGTPVTIVTDSNRPSVLRAAFERGEVGAPAHAFVEHWKRLPTGQHRVTLAVPIGVSGSIEVSPDQPEPGTTASLTVEVNGSSALHDEDSLTEPLPAGYGFTARVEFEDLVAGQ